MALARGTWDLTPQSGVAAPGTDPLPRITLTAMGRLSKLLPAIG